MSTKNMRSQGGIFISVKELMLLTGNTNYQSTAAYHRMIRDCIAPGKKKLTIKEYCDFEQIDYEYVWTFLRE